VYGEQSFIILYELVLTSLVGQAITGLSSTTNAERRYEGDRNALWFVPARINGTLTKTLKQVLHHRYSGCNKYRFPKLLLRIIGSDFDGQITVTVFQGYASPRQ
jgi:hypothetical protein